MNECDWGRNSRPIGLLLAHPLGADFGRIPDPQLELQLVQQTLEPARVPAGFHPHSHGYISLLEFLVKLFGLFAMTEPPFTQSPVSVSTKAICWKPG